MLGGGLSIRCGSDTFDAPAGSFVFLPHGRPHRFWAKDQPAKLLLITVPGGIEDYFHQINNAAPTKNATRLVSTTAYASYLNEPGRNSHPPLGPPGDATTIPPRSSRELDQPGHRHDQLMLSGIGPRPRSDLRQNDLAA